MNDDERQEFRKAFRKEVEKDPDNGWSVIWSFLLDLDERIERLRNPLTPESKEGRATLTLQGLIDSGLPFSPSEEMARRHGLKDKSQGE